MFFTAYFHEHTLLFIINFDKDDHMEYAIVLRKPWSIGQVEEGPGEIQLSLSVCL